MLARRLLPVPLALLALVAAGCGDDKTAKDVTESTSTAATAATTAPAETAAGTSVDKIAKGVGTDLKKAPVFIPTSGTPPTELIKKDLVEGDGKTAKLGDTIEVRYTLQVWHGQQADSSWTRTPNSTSFPLVEGGLIKGWTDGIPGMKVGGRRLLIVPPALGYADQDQGAALPPNSTLIFAVDLVKVSAGKG